MWNLYDVVFNGKKFTTFDAEFVNLAGSEGTFEITEKEVLTPDGKTYTAKSINRPMQVGKPAQPTQAQAQPNSAKIIIDKLDEILKILKESIGDVDGMPEPEDATVDGKDIPF